MIFEGEGGCHVEKRDDVEIMETSPKKTTCAIGTLYGQAGGKPCNGHEILYH